MNIIPSLAELGLYLSFSLLVGHIVLQFVSNSNKPKIEFPKPILLICTLGIILFSLVPVVQVIFFFKKNVGFAAAASTVLTSFQVGQVWLFLSVFSIFLWLTIYLDRSRYIQAFWILLMVIAVGYGSHVSTKSFIVGLFSHTTHFLMVTIWVGVLLHVSWFSKDRLHWSRFLQWFSPLAFVCMLNIFASGFVILFTIENPKEYVNGWATPYGRMLLFKHITIIPVLIFAIINGFLAKKVLSQPEYEPRTWLKAESFILLIVFFFTGALGTLPPPHEIGISQMPAVSPSWLDWLLANNIPAPLKIELAPTFLSLLLMIVSILFLLLITFSFRLKNPVFALLFAACFIFTFYLGLMFSCVLYL